MVAEALSLPSSVRVKNSWAIIEVVSKLTSAEPVLFTSMVCVLFGNVRFPFLIGIPQHE